MIPVSGQPAHLRGGHAASEPRFQAVAAHLRERVLPELVVGGLHPVVHGQPDAAAALLGAMLLAAAAARVHSFPGPVPVHLDAGGVCCSLSTLFSAASF